MSFEVCIYQDAVPEVEALYSRSEWETYEEALFWANKQRERTPFATEVEINEVDA